MISKELCAQIGCETTGEHVGKRMSGQTMHIPMSAVKSLARADPEKRDVRVVIFENEKSRAQIRAEGTRVAVRPVVEKPAFGIFMLLTLPGGQLVLVEVDTGSQALILDERFMKPLGISERLSIWRKK